MKRFRFGGEEGEAQGMSGMASVLMLLSRGGGEGTDHLGRTSPGRVFECKTCNRQFASFQALGGHRASHKKPRLVADGQMEGGLAKPRVHECSICGLEFAIGQALGGHMRRHRPVTRGAGHGLVEAEQALEGHMRRHRPVIRGAGHGLMEAEQAEVRRVVSLDLNLPPSDSDNECRNMVLELTL